MNTELAFRALKSAKAHPERFDMATWFGGPRGGSRRAEVTEDHMPPCGTTACLAGWVTFHAAPVGSRINGALVRVPGAEQPRHIDAYAREALEITQRQADILFYLDSIREVEGILNYLAANPAAAAADLAEETWAIRRGAE